MLIKIQVISKIVIPWWFYVRNNPSNMECGHRSILYKPQCRHAVIENIDKSLRQQIPNINIWKVLAGFEVVTNLFLSTSQTYFILLRSKWLRDVHMVTSSSSRLKCKQSELFVVSRYSPIKEVHIYSTTENLTWCSRKISLALCGGITRIKDV